MKTNATYINEFTGEVFSDKTDCIKSEARSKTSFITNLITDMDLIKDICNSHDYCDSCPFASENVDCTVSILTDKYLDIINNLQEVND
jgi:hypothetical protein